MSFSLQPPSTSAPISLYTGNGSVVGKVEVWRNGEIVHLRVESLWPIQQVQAAVAETLEGIPQTKKGNPIPGQFPIKLQPAPATYTVELGFTLEAVGLEGPQGVIALHAVLLVDENGTLTAKGAWAGEESFPGPNWARFASLYLNGAPVATISVTEGDELGSFLFDGSGSSDPEQDPLDFIWDMGDGSAFVSGPTASHSFAQVGIYQVTLTVTDVFGAQASASVEVEALPLGPDVTWVSCTVSPANPKESEAVTFEAVLQNVGASPISIPSNYTQVIAMTDDGMGGYGVTLYPAGETLAPGETFLTLLNWNAFSRPPGDYHPRIWFDPEQRLPEANEDNNSITCPVTLTPETEFPDLIISTVELTDPNPTVSSEFKARVTVTNQGTGVAEIRYPDYVVYSPQTQYWYPSEWTPWVLAPGESVTEELRISSAAVLEGTFLWSFTVDPYNQVRELDEGNNQATLTVTIGPPDSANLTDVTWVSCTVSPANPKESETVTFEAVLQNVGANPISIPSNYTQVITMTDDGMGGYGLTLYPAGETLDPGDTFLTLLSWSPFSRPPGDYYPRIWFDSEQRLSETDEDNNVITCPVTLAPETEFPDLIISNVELTDPNPTVSSEFKARVTVTNQGTGVAQIRYPYYVVYSPQTQYWYPPTWTPWVLAPGESVTKELMISSAAVQEGTFLWSFAVDPNNQVRELDETNNQVTLTVTIGPG